MAETDFSHATMSRKRAWMFTLNNPDMDDDLYEAEFRRDASIRYYVFQREEGLSEGTPHLQGYLYLHSGKTLMALVRGAIDCLQGAHWEFRRGTHEQAKAYCSKADTRVSGPYEGGEPPAQGRRTDLHTLVDFVIEHPEMTMRELLNNADLRYAAFKNQNNVAKLRLIYMPKRDFLTQCTWLYGPTGTGKSFLARKLAGEHDTVPVYYKMPDNRWWEGYSGENTIIDDFASSMPYRELLRIIDQYPHTVEIKGAAVQFSSKLLIITSHSPPWDHYPNVGDKSELRRRLNGRVFYCSAIGTVVPVEWFHAGRAPSGHHPMYL